MCYKIKISKFYLHRTGGCVSNKRICKLQKDIKGLEDENEAMRDAYAVNYTAALTEYQSLRDALYKYVRSATAR